MQSKRRGRNAGCPIVAIDAYQDDDGDENNRQPQRNIAGEWQTNEWQCIRYVFVYNADQSGWEQTELG